MADKASSKAPPKDSPNKSGGGTLAVPVQRKTLSPKLANLVERAKKQKEEEVFFSWTENDTAVIQVTGRKIIPTRVGDNALYSAVYMSGNIEGQPGAPKEPGQAFGFYAQTVLESAFERLGLVGPSDEKHDDLTDGKALLQPNTVVLVSCLGVKDGKSYYDFICRPLSDEDLALAEGEETSD